MLKRPILTLAFLLNLSVAALGADGLEERLEKLFDEAEQLTPLHTIVVAHEGSVVAERGYRGHSPARPANIKSASKSIISALVGIAIDKGVLQGTDQKIAPLLQADLPADADPRLQEVTIGHLLSMQAGLGRTSGPNYGRWVASDNWVRAALAMPFDDEPGGAMLYSTGSTHLLSAILTRRTGRSTLDLAREWLGPQEGFSVAAWDRDRQGLYIGGNQMAMSPRSLLAFGELYRSGGMSRGGQQLVPANWIKLSWQPRTASRFTGDGYGYGWFLRQIAGEAVFYGWGYGGQMVYVVPGRALTVVMTSDENGPAGRSGHRDDLHALLERIIEAMESMRDDALAD
jgi:CubicO group peptidase (beta-lactamase class C family)